MASIRQHPVARSGSSRTRSYITTERGSTYESHLFPDQVVDLITAEDDSRWVALGGGHFVRIDTIVAIAAVL